jgi:hypothetical protein
VDGLGDEFLAGAGFALQQHGGVGRGDPGDELEHVAEGRRAAEQALGAGEPRAPGSGSSFSMNQAISPSLPRIGDSSMFS